MNRTRCTLGVALLALGAVTNAQLWNNGPFVTHPGGGFAGADASALQNTSQGLTIFGFGHQITAGNWMADDFTVGAGGWNITGMSFFAYQTGSTTSSTMNDLRMEIYNGDPSSGGTLVFGDTLTNRLSATSWSNAYRTLESDTGTATNRPIMKNDANFNLFLAAGTYWVKWQTGGTLASGPWAPPVSLLGQTGKPGANAKQLQGTTWVNAVDGTTPQDLPFLVHGSAVPEPASMIALGLGAAALAARRRRKKAA